MRWVNSICFLLALILPIFFIKREKERGYAQRAQKNFYLMGMEHLAVLYALWRMKRENPALKEALQLLYPMDSRDERIKKVYVRRFYSLYFLWLAVHGIAACAGFISENVQHIDNDSHISRDLTKGVIQAEVSSQTIKGSTVDIYVNPMLASGDAKEALFEQAYAYIQKEALGKNESWQAVRQPLNLLKALPDFGITAVWETAGDGLIDALGGINNEGLPMQGKDTSISVQLTYGREMREYTIEAHVLPVLKSREEVMLEDIKTQLDRNDQEDAEKAYLSLPQYSMGEHLSWQEKRDNTALKATAAGIIACAALMIYSRSENKKKLQKRSGELETDYPELIYKLVLLMGAGMTVKGAVNAIVEEEKKKDAVHMHYVYKELELALQSMCQGTPELEAYERFGKRCGTPAYLKLSSMLTQCIRMGAGGMGTLLSDTASEAMLLRKEHAKSQGEKAGMKLLMPMGVMLVIVFAILIVPAFMSMNL